MQSAISGRRHNYVEWSYMTIQACRHGFTHSLNVMTCLWVGKNFNTCMCSSRQAETEEQTWTVFPLSVLNFLNMHTTKLFCGKLTDYIHSEVSTHQTRFADFKQSEIISNKDANRAFPF